MSYSPPIVDRLPPVRLLMPVGLEFTVNRLIRGSATNVLNSGAWPSANDPIALPFFLSQPETVYQLGWRNGSAAGGNWDVGIYSSAWVRLVSTGSTAGSGNSTLQFVDVTDTALNPGQYYLAASLDNTTANRVSHWAVASTPALGLCGVQDSATDAFALPNPLTNMAEAATFTNVPVLVAALRSLV